MSSLDEDTDGGDATPEQPARILVVDDEEMICILLTDVLSDEGYEVVTASDGQEAVDLLERERIDLIITDMVMPGLNGIEVLRTAKRLDPQRPVIVMTGYPSVETVRRLIRLGAEDYITKPFNVDIIKVTVAKLLEMRRVDGESSSGNSPGQNNPGHHAEAPEQERTVDELTGACVPAEFTRLIPRSNGRSGVDTPAAY